MAKVTDHYFRWLAEKLTRYDQIILLGFLIWLKWGEDFCLPHVDPRAPAFWTDPVFFILGLAGNQYYRLFRWWSELQIRWILRLCWWW